MDFSKVFEKKVREEMDKQGFTAKTLSSVSGVSEYIVKKIIKGEYKKIRVIVVVKICRTLKISVDGIYAEAIRSMT